jgi:hypothetical protein
VVRTEKTSSVRDELRKEGFIFCQFEDSQVPPPSDFCVSLSLRQRAGVRAIRQSKLNVQSTTDPRYQSFLANATEREVLEARVPVASLEDIIRGKVWAWRDPARRLSKRKKDELDLVRIAEAYPQLRALIPNEIVAQL